MLQDIPPLPRALGVASAGLGLPPLVAPRRFLRTIGVKQDATTTAVARAVGVQELGAAGGILGLEAPRPKGWMWARAAGDAIHLALLGAAYARRRDDGDRIAAAAGFVGVIAAADVYAAIRLSRDGMGAPPQVREAVTIRRPRDEVRAAWSGFDFGAKPLKGSGPDAGFLSFEDAPGDRGTEVRVRLDDGLAAPVKDDLRRFKQVLETGGVVRADGSPGGDSILRRLKQRPAQPVDSTS